VMSIARFLRQTHHTRNMLTNDPTVTNTSGRCHACEPKVVTIPKFTPIGAQTARLRMRSLRGRLASWGVATNHTMKAPQSPPHKRTDSHWLAVPMPFSRPPTLSERRFYNSYPLGAASNPMIFGDLPSHHAPYDAMMIGSHKFRTPHRMFLVKIQRTLT